MDRLIYINEEVTIPISEIKFQFSRSGGKGGQHINKVETRVELFFNIENSQSLTESQKNTLYKNLHRRIDSNGEVRIISQVSRSQWKNRENAIQLFVKLMQNALVPKKKRIPTKPTEISREKRLKYKKRRSIIKQLRKNIE